MGGAVEDGGVEDETGGFGHEWRRDQDGLLSGMGRGLN